MSFEIGTRVKTSSGNGKVVFAGQTQFAEGEWIGVILDTPTGKNNGTVKDVAYFQCEPNYGVFVKASAVELEDTVKRSGLKAPTASAIRKDSSVMSRSAGSKASPGSSPGISPAASSEKLSGRQTGMGPRSVSKLVDPNESRMVREFSNLSQSSVASSRASASTSKPRPQFTAPDAASRRQSLAPPKKVSTTVPPAKNNSIAKPRQSMAPSKPTEETKPAESETEVPNELPPPTMTESGTVLPNESVLSRAKKIDDTGPAAPMSPISTTSAAAHPRTTSISSNIDHSTELEYLRIQVKELTDKLETTRAKRKDDHAKLLEFERISIEHRTLQDVKSRLNDKVVELERQLLEERRSAEELRAWHEDNKNSIEESKELMEMATIEKELAEEKADVAEIKINELTEELEKMRVKLGLLEDEMANGGGGAQVGNTVQMRQIEMQNDKLKDALIKMRDLSAQAKLDQQKAVEEAERLKNENSELIRVAENLKRQAEIAESKIAGFQEQIDAAMGAEAMVTQLTDKNFNMEERIAQLEETIEDMEEAKDLDEQLAEVQKQQEKDLMKEIEQLKIHIHELNGRIRDEQKHAAELSQTILKFRERMANLNSQIQDQKDQILSLEEQVHGQTTEDNDRATMFNQLQISANRNFSEIVERQINAIEVEYARRQAGYLKAFLPDNFARVGGENDSILLVVLLPRLSAKATLFATLAAQCYPQVPGGMRREHVTKSHKGEQWAHVARVSYLANSIVAAVGKLESAVGETTVEALIKLTESYGEMATHERAIDQYLELLKTSRFDENTSLDGFIRPLAYFQMIFSLQFGGDGFNASQWISSVCSSLTAGLAYCRVNTQRISYFLQESVNAGEVFNLLQSLNDEFAACESVILKAARLLPNGSDPRKIIKLESDFTDELLNAVAQLDKMASTLQEVCTNGAHNFGGISETEGFDDKRVKEMIHSVVAKSSGYIAIENTFDPIRTTMRSLRDSLEKVNSTLESAKMEHVAPEKKTFPPLLDRAHHRKQAAQEAEGLRWQMEKKDNEMLELRKQIKARIEDVSNFKLRLDMAESRLNSTDKAEGDKVKHLEEKINQMVADHRRKQIIFKFSEFDESMDALQREMKEVEGENLELKQRANKISKEALWKNIHAMETRSAGAPTAPSSSSVVEEGSASRGEVVFLENQLNKQTDARKRAELEIRKLKGELAQSGSKRFSTVPGLISGPVTLESQTRQDLLLKLLDNLHDESLRLRREEVSHQTYVPSNPKISTERMLEEMEKFNAKREQFYDKLNSVNRRLRRVWFDAWGEEYPFDIATSIRSAPPVPESKKFDEVSAKWGIVW
ncbi:Protein CBR-DNC-1 [Caenorhabditis briggsae]|uniref:Dynactin subunit 1 n=1 Tax=Caenorhabditis briggsae TaxID=6238 RepID=A8X184_CAEBR|nr:Protein CBR-DNC-1 [Caenorhabditis briggsae]CAP26394.2 Protein CBR-DNC-1 [Caenorhabditis briggsae]